MDWRRPPGKVWTGLLVVLLGAVLWRASQLGFGVLDLVTFMVFALMGLVWLVRLIGWTVRPSDHRTRAWRWGIAPMLVAAFAILVGIGLPLRVRFALAQSDLDRAVQGRPSCGSNDDWCEADDLAGRYGSFRFSNAFQVGNAVILYSTENAFFDDTGLAYLPDGPDPKLGNGAFEAPHFTHLGGHWYRWTASW